MCTPTKAATRGSEDQHRTAIERFAEQHHTRWDHDDRVHHQAVKGRYPILMICGTMFLGMSSALRATASGSC